MWNTLSYWVAHSDSKISCYQVQDDVFSRTHCFVPSVFCSCFVQKQETTAVFVRVRLNDSTGNSRSFMLQIDT